MIPTDLLLEFVRAFLIYAHLLIFAVAFSLVTWSDFSILINGVHKTPFKLIINVISCLLFLLWTTGLLIVYIDTQFDIQTMMQKPKLMLKLVCVTVLSLNGFVLHLFCFKHLLNREPLKRKYAVVMSVFGAISTTNWLLAAFVGSATVLNHFSFQQLLIIYVAIMFLAVLIAIAISGLIQLRINQLRAGERLNLLGISSYSERHKFDAHC